LAELRETVVVFFGFFIQLLAQRLVNLDRIFIFCCVFRWFIRDDRCLLPAQWGWSTDALEVRGVELGSGSPCNDMRDEERYYVGRSSNLQQPSPRMKYDGVSTAFLLSENISVDE